MADDDLGTCPYYARYEGLTTLPWFDPEGTCYRGCYDEPECVTCVPRGGWPSVHRALADASTEASS